MVRSIHRRCLKLGSVVGKAHGNSVRVVGLKDHPSRDVLARNWRGKTSWHIFDQRLGAWNKAGARFLMSSQAHRDDLQRALWSFSPHFLEPLSICLVSLPSKEGEHS